MTGKGGERSFKPDVGDDGRALNEDGGDCKFRGGGIALNRLRSGCEITGGDADLVFGRSSPESDFTVGADPTGAAGNELPFDEGGGDKALEGAVMTGLAERRGESVFGSDGGGDGVLGGGDRVFGGGDLVCGGGLIGRYDLSFSGGGGAGDSGESASFDFDDPSNFPGVIVVIAAGGGGLPGQNDSLAGVMILNEECAGGLPG